MSSSDAILARALRLSVEDRRFLVLRLLESVEDIEPTAVTDDVRFAEVQRTWRAFEAGEVKLAAWEDARARMSRAGK